ncbi:hypothetical protein IEQ34_008544 [Dendrobium chrysotoxum]|uniref:Uncharacterized protein n=1 Tax=Dendrobium chrysotoxum TaxID=161865 RepID=A0AAV7GZP7_DENCH|nr:hypothetical protein IEQ34_008544 [Dendrobium chrysotoxum]
MSKDLRTDRVGVGVPSLWEGLVGLCSHPNSKHELPLLELFPLLVLETVPLGSQRTIRGNTMGYIGEIQLEAADKVVFHDILVLYCDLEVAGLEAVPREGESLVEDGVLILLQVLGDALIVAEFHLNVGIQATSNVHGWEIASFNDVDVQELHREDEIVGGGDLVATSVANAAGKRRSGLNKSVFGLGAGSFGCTGRWGRRFLEGIESESDVAADIGKKASLVEREAKDLGFGRGRGHGDAGDADPTEASMMAACG